MEAAVGCLRADELDDVIELVAQSLLSMPAAAAVSVCGRLRDRLDAVEASVLAHVVSADDGDSVRASRLAKRPGSTRRDSRRRADRAKAVSKNPALGERLAAGGLSSPNHRMAWRERDLADAAGNARRTSGSQGCVGRFAIRSSTAPTTCCEDEVGVVKGPSAFRFGGRRVSSVRV